MVLLRVVAMVKKIPLAGVTVEFKIEGEKGVLKVGSTRIVLEKSRVVVNERRSKTIEWRSGSRGLVYVGVTRKLLPGESMGLVDYKSFVEKSFLIQVIKSTVGDYLVIVTPGNYSYERIIVYENKIAVEYEDAEARVVDLESGFSIEFQA